MRWSAITKALLSQRASSVSPLPPTSHLGTALAEQTLGNRAVHLTLGAITHFCKLPILPHSVMGASTSFFFSPAPLPVLDW